MGQSRKYATHAFPAQPTPTAARSTAAIVHSHTNNTAANRSDQAQTGQPTKQTHTAGAKGVCDGGVCGRVKPKWVPSAVAPLAPYLAGVERVAGARARVVSIVVRGPQTCKRRRHHAQEQAHVTHDNARGQTRTFREKLWTTLATTAPSATRRMPARYGTSNATTTIAYTQQRRRVRQLQRHGLRAGASYTNAVTKHHRNMCVLTPKR